jgi:hypothetical protein
MTTQNPPPNGIDISRPDFRSAGQPRSLRGGVGRKPSI